MRRQKSRRRQNSRRENKIKVGKVGKAWFKKTGPRRWVEIDRS